MQRCVIKRNRSGKKSAPKGFINITVSEEVYFQLCRLADETARTAHSIADEVLRYGLGFTEIENDAL